MQLTETKEHDEPQPGKPCKQASYAYFRQRFVPLLDDLRAIRSELLTGGGEDSVHRLRITARRMRSVLDSMGNVMEPELADPVRQGLRAIGQTTNPLRDLEVQTELLEELDLSERTRLRVGAWMLWLAKSRMRCQADICVWLRGNYQELLNGYIHELLAAPPRGKKDRRTGKLARRTVTELARRLRKGLKRAARKPRNVALQHRVRIRAKRLRYACEFYADALPKRYRRLQKSARKLQGTLGALRDTELLLERIEEAEHLDADSREELRSELLQRRGDQLAAAAKLMRRSRKLLRKYC